MAHRRRRPLLVTAAVLVAAVLGAVAWLAWTATQARSELERARSSLGPLRAAVLDADVGRARAALVPAAGAAARAHRLTSGPVWATAAAIPGLGRPLETARGLAADTDALLQGPLTSLLDSAGALTPDKLRGPGGQVEVSRLARAAPRLTQAAYTLARLRRDVAGLPSDTGVGAVDRARTTFLSALDELDGTVAGAARLARVAPPMLGADGPRRYLIVVQNPTESRGTGGLLGAYGVLRADHGRLHIEHTGPNGDLQPFASPVINLGKHFRDLYNGFGATRLWQQANVSPHFPYAARIWTAMWHQQRGGRLDGVIATDPIAMGYLLRATGPVTLPDGERITADNIARITMHDAYARFADPTARDAYLQVVAKAVLHRALSGRGDAAALLQQLRRAATEGRLQVYSTHHSTEKELADSALGGVLPARSGPFAALVVNDISASKLDYYLDRSVTYRARGACAGGRRHTTVRVQLTNTAPKSGVPAYMLNHLGSAAGLGPAMERLQVAVYLARGADMNSVTLDGTRIGAGFGLERGHLVVTFPVDIPAGRSRTVLIHVTEPASTKQPVVPVQPLVRPQRTRVDVPAC